MLELECSRVEVLAIAAIDIEATAAAQWKAKVAIFFIDHKSTTFY